MRVILLQDVKNVGKKGETIEVSNGYANNFLIPRRLAVIETTRSKEVLEKENEDKRLALEEEKKLALIVKEKLETIVLTFEVAVGNDQKIFGSISTKQIEAELKNLHKIEIDRRRFLDKVSINTLGKTNLRIELSKGVVGVVVVRLIAKE